jgi:uncharacterized membrane protein
MRSFVRFNAYMMLLFGAVWVVVSFLEHLYAVTILVVAMIGIAIYSLYLIRSGSSLTGKKF